MSHLFPSVAEHFYPEACTFIFPLLKKNSYNLSLSMQLCFIFTDSYPKQYLKLTYFWGFYASCKSSITLHCSPFCWPSTENFHHQGEEAPPSLCAPPRTLNIPSAGPVLEPGLVTSHSLLFFLFLFISPLYPKTTATSLHSRSGTNISTPMPSVWFTTKTWWGCADPDSCGSFQLSVFMNPGCSFCLNGGTSHHSISLRHHLDLKCSKSQ